MINQSLVLMFFFLCYSWTVKAQVGFERTYGDLQDDNGYSVELTADSGYILVGSTKSYATTGIDIYLVKVNKMGDTIWTRNYDNGADEIGYAVQQIDNNEYILAGYKYPYPYQLILINTDSLGNELWKKEYELSGFHSPYGKASVQKTNDNGFILLGDEAFNYYLIKTDSVGDTLWTKRYVRNPTLFEDMSTFKVRQTSDNGYMLFGGHGNYLPSVLAGCMYAIKTDSIGDTLWTKSFGPCYSTGEMYIGRDIEETTNKGFVLVGSEKNSFMGDLTHRYKIDSSGNLIWSKLDYGMFGHSVSQTVDDGFIFLGERWNWTQIDLYCMRTDSLGDTLWTKTFGGTSYDVGYSVRQTTDNGFILLGSTNSFNNGSSYMYLIKIDSMGHVLSLFENTPSMAREKILISPNPFYSSTVIEFDNPMMIEHELILYNSTGQLIRKIRNIEPQSVKIERGNLISGLYYFQLVNDKKNVGSGKLIIE